MTSKEEMLNCKLGVYRIWWKSGGSSVASIGNDYNGNRWMAPANWTCPRGENPTTMLSKWVDQIKRMTRLG